MYVVGNCRPPTGLSTSLNNLRIFELVVFALKPLHVLCFFRFNYMTSFNTKQTKLINNFHTNDPHGLMCHLT